MWLFHWSSQIYWHGIFMLPAQSLSYARLFVATWTVACQLLLTRHYPGKNTGICCHFILQGIFSTRGSNPHLLHLLHWPVHSFPLCHLRNHALCVFVCVCVYVWLEEEIWMFYFYRGTNWVSLRKNNVFPDFWFVLVGFKNSFIPSIIVLNFYLHKFLIFNIASCLLVLARVWNLIQN